MVLELTRGCPILVNINVKMCCGVTDYGVGGLRVCWQSLSVNLYTTEFESNNVTSDYVVENPPATNQNGDASNDS